MSISECVHNAEFTDGFCDDCGVHYSDAANEILSVSWDIPSIGELVYYYEQDTDRYILSKIIDVEKNEAGNYYVSLANSRYPIDYQYLFDNQKDFCDKYMDQGAGISDNIEDEVEAIQKECMGKKNKERLITVFESIDPEATYEMLFIDAPDKTALTFLAAEFSNEFLKSYVYEVYTIAIDDDMKEAMLQFFRKTIEDAQIDTETEILFFSADDVKKSLSITTTGSLVLVQSGYCGVYSPSTVFKCNLVKGHKDSHQFITLKNGIEKVEGTWTVASSQPPTNLFYTSSEYCPKKILPQNVYCNRKKNHQGACSTTHDPGFKSYPTTAISAGPPCHSGDIKIFEKGNLTCYAGGKSRGGGDAALDLMVDLLDVSEYDLKQVGTFDSELQKVIDAQQGTYATYLNINWKDFGVNHNLTVDFWKNLAKYVRAKAKKGAFRIEAMCMGGHGRTGTFWACLGYHLNLYNKKKEDPVSWIRRVHCTHAVETEGQIKYVEKITGVKIPEAVAKTLKHGAITTYTSYNTSSNKTNGAATGANVSLFNQPADAAYAATVNDGIYIPDIDNLEGDPYQFFH